MKNFLQNKDYNWIKEIRSSDHKPVYAVFDLSIPKNNPSERAKLNKRTNSKTCLLF